MNTTNIAFVWTGVNGYMADCWRELAARPGVRLKIVIEERRDVATAFNAAETLRGLDAEVVYADALDESALRASMKEFRPARLFLVGWHAATPRFFALDPAFRKVPKTIVFDLPFAWTPRKIAARFALRSYLRHFDSAFVPGEVAARYARWLGFPDEQIYHGLFSIAKPTSQERTALAKRFLYIGRYAPEKRIDRLLEAYRWYRNRVRDPWPLVCCGTGQEASRLRGVEGVEDRGFLQPSEIQELYNEGGILLLASDFDPWPLVILEAVANGIPVVCTNVCGNVDELLSATNGIALGRRDLASFVQKLVSLHEATDSSLLEMGVHGRRLAEPYYANRWADRVLRIMGNS